MNYIKFGFLAVICTITAVIGLYKVVTLEHLIYASEISEGGYVVKIYQKRGNIPDRRQAFIDVRKEGRIIVDHSIIFSGGFFNEPFDDRYPQKSWLTPDIFAFGSLQESATDELVIENSGAIALDYVYIQTHKDHFIILDLRPKSKRVIQFHYNGIVAIQAMNSKGEKFAKAVTRDESVSPENTAYEVGISNTDISIDCTKYRLRESNCCFYRW